MTMMMHSRTHQSDTLYCIREHAHTSDRTEMPLKSPGTEPQPLCVAPLPQWQKTNEPV